MVRQAVRQVNKGETDRLTFSSVSLSLQVTKNHQVIVSTGYGTGVSLVKVIACADLQCVPRMPSAPLTFDPAVRAAEDGVLRDGGRLRVVQL